MQLTLFEIDKEFETVVCKSIGGRNGVNCRILSMVDFDRENKYLIEFPNGVKFWTNHLAIIKI